MKYGLIDNTGKILIKPKYSSVESFSEGMACVARFISKEKKELYGFIDRTGKEVIELKYELADNFFEGLASVQTENGRIQYIDKSAKIVISLDLKKYPEGDNLVSESGFSNGLAKIDFVSMVKPRLKVGYIDKKGKWAVELFYGKGKDFSEGLAAVYDSEDEKWGFIDKNGKWIIEPQFSEANDFIEGLASVAISNTTKGGVETKWGFIDKKGAFQIPHNTKKKLTDENGTSMTLGYLNDAKDAFNIVERSGVKRKVRTNLLKVHVGGIKQGTLVSYFWRRGGWFYMDRKGNLIAVCKQDD